MGKKTLDPERKSREYEGRCFVDYRETLNHP